MKRKRSLDWWDKAVGWIHDNGGLVHSFISIHNDDENERKLVVNQEVKKDEILMMIPFHCIPSCGGPIQDTSSIGKKLGACIASVVADDASSNTSRNELFCDQQDLLLALTLAYQSEHGWDHDKDSDFRPYIDTLPQSESFNMLPRRWNKKQKQLLQGSSIVRRIEKATVGVMNDYKLLSEQWNHDGPTPFPSFVAFDTMLAAVTSRAFAGMGISSQNDQDIAMVPLLDLCNHHRGGDSVRKNVSYRRTKDGVQVIAYETLPAGSILQITYGAKGNAQLLYNYGFCIPNNIEPDGSSNDVVEVELNGRAVVLLRTGPKSYTFGCMSKAIEQFHSLDETTETPTEDDDPGNDLEDFLNECDANPGVCGFVDDDEDDHSEDENDCDDEDDDAERMEKIRISELKAVLALQKALIARRSEYHLQFDRLDKAIASNDLHHRYAGLLIHSELCTIKLYELGCKRIAEKLAERKIDEFQWDVTLTAPDQKRLYEQAEELADAFIRIRCSSF